MKVLRVKARAIEKLHQPIDEAAGAMSSHVKLINRIRYKEQMLYQNVQMAGSSRSSLRGRTRWANLEPAILLKYFQHVIH